MEKILQQILEGQANLFSELGTVKNEVGKISGELGTVKNEVGKLNSEIRKINQRLDEMPTKADLDKVIAEQQKDIIAMLERTATKESVAELSDDIEALNRRIFKQEAKIIRLEKVKEKRA